MAGTGKLNQDLIDRVAAEVRTHGLYPHRAAIACGVGERTHYRWLQFAQDEIDQVTGEATGIYGQYYLAIRQAETEAQKDWTAHLKAAVAGQWQKYAWLLERRFKDEWTQLRAAPADPDKTTKQTVLVVNETAANNV